MSDEPSEAEMNKKAKEEQDRIRNLRIKSNLDEKIRKLRQLYGGGLTVDAEAFAKTLKPFEQYFTEDELELYMKAGG